VVFEAFLLLLGAAMKKVHYAGSTKCVQALQIKKGGWQKEGKRSHPPLCKLKGIINADPPLRTPGKGVGGW
jgi:hypothetical protein